MEESTKIQSSRAKTSRGYEIIQPDEQPQINWRGAHTYQHAKKINTQHGCYFLGPLVVAENTYGFMGMCVVNCCTCENMVRAAECICCKTGHLSCYQCFRRTLGEKC